MINKNDYLYWLNNNDEEITDETVYREMYSRIGYLFHVIQMIEYNIANIVAIEEFVKEEKTVYDKIELDTIKAKIDAKFKDLLKTKTFGQLLCYAEKNDYLKGFDFKELRIIKDYRDYLAHNCFKLKLMNNELNTIEDADAFVKELNEYEVKTKNLNKKLIERFEKVAKQSVLIKK